jgi:hypothetical protein
MRRPGVGATITMRQGVTLGVVPTTACSALRSGGVESLAVRAFGIPGTPPTYIPA